MITASHNPAADNGYKIYWENACQIISPHDVGISQSIQKNLEPWMDYSSMASPSVHLITEEAVSSYLAHATSILHSNSIELNQVILWYDVNVM